MRAWLSRHLGGKSDKHVDKEPLSLPPKKQWPPPPKESEPEPKPAVGPPPVDKDRPAEKKDKTVTFTAPPTPAPQTALDDVHSDDNDLPPLPQVPQKTSLSRFQARQSTSDSSKLDLNRASPYPQSARSATPYSQMTSNTTASRILAATSWSEVTEGDLVSNLGSRERTRQEVLFEIISSEER
jgi:hypothetical protein